MTKYFEHLVCTYTNPLDKRKARFVHCGIAMGSCRNISNSDLVYIFVAFSGLAMNASPLASNKSLCEKHSIPSQALVEGIVDSSSALFITNRPVWNSCWYKSQSISQLFGTKVKVSVNSLVQKVKVSALGTKVKVSVNFLVQSSYEVGTDFVPTSGYILIFFDRGTRLTSKQHVASHP